jgi:hypothetical protein
MSRHEATFEIDSASDSYAAKRILGKLYDTVREESRQVRAGGEDSDELLDSFAALRDALDGQSSGRLTVALELEGGGFDD